MKISVKVRGYEGQGAGSGVIQKFRRSRFSHVSLVFTLGEFPTEIEAIQGKGVVKHYPYLRAEKNFIEYDVPLTEDQALDALQTADSLVGSKYDWLGAAGFVTMRKKHDPFKWFCSELVAYSLLKAGYALSRRDPYLEAPDTVMGSFRLLERPIELGEDVV